MIGSSEKEEKGLPAFALPNHSFGNRLCPSVLIHTPLGQEAVQALD
jgi:hypothetical protein